MRPTPCLALLFLLFVSWGGCTPKTNRFNIQDHRALGPAQHYFERFDECFYCRDAFGHYDVVARRRGTVGVGDGPPFDQIIHIRQVWEAKPGRTAAESSMINATVSYLIVGPDGGASFEGGGFITLKENRRGDELTGHLESSALTPQRRLGSGADVFAKASVTGRFRARRDKRQVVRVVNEMKRLFGPLPPYEPPPVNPDLR
ncbi:MAG: hypothetical protein GY778_26850 [bacterium]|nr:hypothetical protein [bacterium]